jgi:energy-coupling factor transporter ATP-binding protein EcfA2
VRLSGKNFQSWAEFDAEIDGLTVVTGPSDVGKSALFRALKGVLRNELPVEWVRNGQDEPMGVTVEVGSHRISAERKRKGSTTYVIDGQDFAKLDKAVPEQIKDLKFGEVVIGDFDFDPIFGRQNSAQFLIDPLTYKPTEVNAILGAFGGTEKLEHGKKEANLRKTQKDTEARAIAAQIRDAEERRAKLTSMQLAGDQTACALIDLERDIRGLESGAHWLAEAARYRQEIVRYRQILDAFVLPDIAGLEQEYRLARFAEQAAESNAYARWLAKPVAMLSSASAFWDDIGRLRYEIAALESAQKAGEYASWLHDTSLQLQAVPMVWVEVRRVWNEIVALEIAVEAGSHVVSTDKLKSSLSGVDATFNGAALLWNSIRRLEALSALLGELKGSAEKLSGVEAELSAAQAELQKGLCPKCGRPLAHQCV